MIRFLIDIYILVLVVDAVISFLPQFKNERWALTIRQVAGYTLDPVRRVLRRTLPELPFDISPLIVIIALKLFVALF